ncbi:MAG: hypothetical protein HYV09_34260 [Deltaproteobacteria bacterium]|nr:hypothetical protein [Deltaproteobacteria bacterium]
MSSARWDPEAPTPFDAQPWPDRLRARVVPPGEPRIHGYDAPTDLARHYRFSDAVLLALTGELPDEPRGRAFELALICLAPVSVAEAPTHAAVLARVCDGSASSVIATGAIALAEQARVAVAEHAAFLAAAAAGSLTGDGHPAAAPVRAALAEIGVQIHGVDHAPSYVAALLAVLQACGLTRGDQLESAWMVARIGVVAAEAFATPGGGFKDYPLNVPPFAYSEAPRPDGSRSEGEP